MVAISKLWTGCAYWCKLSGEDSRGDCRTEQPAWSITETNSVAPGNMSILITAQDSSSQGEGEPENKRGAREEE